MTKLLEVAIGVSAIMLLLSMAVTVITQFILTTLNQRGRDLVRGIGELIHQLDPTLQLKVTSQIADTLLRHPLLRGNLNRAGDVVHREELTALLMDLGSGIGSFGQHPLQATAAAMLKKNGIANPGATLDAVREFSMQLETQSPELATHVRQSMAILRAAESTYVAKINAWFDQTIDRVSQRFTSSTRAITMVIGILVAFVLQLDTIELVNRLFVDDSLRAKLVALAPEIQKSAETGGKPAAKETGAVTGAGETSAAAAPASANIPSAGSAQSGGQPTAQNQQPADYYRELSAAGLIAFPSAQSFSWNNLMARFPGVLLTALLLSLGAPFWYNALSSLLKLRSPSAQKDDQQRTERQASQAAPGVTTDSPDGGSAVVAARIRLPIMPSEQGDLNAVG